MFAPVNSRLNSHTVIRAGGLMMRYRQKANGNGELARSSWVRTQPRTKLRRSSIQTRQKHRVSPRDHHHPVSRVSMPIAAIRVGERYRKKLKNIERLAASIKSRGLLQPIVVSP